MAKKVHSAAQVASIVGISFSEILVRATSIGAEPPYGWQPSNPGSDTDVKEEI
jgi:hypothetical protein